LLRNEKSSLVAELIQKTNELIRYFEEKDLPIIKIQTVHKADKSTWNLWALENDTGRLILGTKLKFGELMLDALKRRFGIIPVNNKEIMGQKK